MAQPRYVLAIEIPCARLRASFPPPPFCETCYETLPVATPDQRLDGSNPVTGDHLVVVVGLTVAEQPGQQCPDGAGHRHYVPGHGADNHAAGSVAGRHAVSAEPGRSEERRVGKEWRCR